MPSLGPFDLHVATIVTSIFFGDSDRTYLTDGLILTGQTVVRYEDAFRGVRRHAATSTI